MLSDNFIIEPLDTKTWCIWNFYKTILDNRLAIHLNKILPPWDINRMEFKSKEILCSCCCMSCSHESNRSFSHMNSHSYTIILCHISNLLSFKNTTCRKNIWVNNSKCSRLQ